MNLPVAFTSPSSAETAGSGGPSSSCTGFGKSLCGCTSTSLPEHLWGQHLQVANIYAVRHMRQALTQEALMFWCFGYLRMQNGHQKDGIGILPTASGSAISTSVPAWPDILNIQIRSGGRQAAGLVGPSHGTDHSKLLRMIPYLCPDESVDRTYHKLP